MLSGCIAVKNCGPTNDSKAVLKRLTSFANLTTALCKLSEPIKFGLVEVFVKLIFTALSIEPAKPSRYPFNTALVTASTITSNGTAAFGIFNPFVY